PPPWSTPRRCRPWAEGASTTSRSARSPRTSSPSATSRAMKRDEATYGGISRKFEEWEEIQANRPPTPRVVPPQRPYTPEPVTDGDMGKTLFSAIGIGIGAVLLLLSVLAFANAAKWAGFDRD